MSNKRETVDKIYQLLISLVEEDEPVHQPAPPKKTTKKKSTTNRISKTKTIQTNENSSQRLNKFDSMAEKNMFRDDIAIDRKLSVQPPCPRTRSYATIDVSCRVCGKTDKVNPALVSEPSRYKCNSCARSGG